MGSGLLNILQISGVTGVGCFFQESRAILSSVFFWGVVSLDSDWHFCIFLRSSRSFDSSSRPAHPPSEPRAEVSVATETTLRFLHGAIGLATCTVQQGGPSAEDAEAAKRWEALRETEANWASCCNHTKNYQKLLEVYKGQ